MQKQFWETELHDRLNAFETRCRECGLRVTQQRRAIFRAVASSREHPSAETVFYSVRKRMPNMSLDTVYRTLASLEGMNLLTRVGLSSKERFDADLRPHSHFVCTRCGEVYDVFFEQGILPDFSKEAQSMGEVKQLNVQFRGICNRCRDEKKTPEMI